MRGWQGKGMVRYGGGKVRDDKVREWQGKG